MGFFFPHCTYLTFSNLDALFDLNQCLTIYQSFYSSRETHLFFSDDHLFNRFGSKVKAEEKRLHNFIDLKGHLNLCFFLQTKISFKLMMFLLKTLDLIEKPSIQPNTKPRIEILLQMVIYLLYSEAESK